MLPVVVLENTSLRKINKENNEIDVESMLTFSELWVTQLLESGPSAISTTSSILILAVWPE